MHPRTPRRIPESTRVAVVDPAGEGFGGSVVLPGSKSLTNRSLLVAGLARGTSVLENVLACDDSLYLVDALRALGVQVDEEEGEVDPTGARQCILRVCGAGGPFPVKQGAFHLGNAGTTTRFLTAALAASRGSYTVDGDARMRERPIDDLVRALRELGCDLDAPSGCPPVTIRPGAPEGGRVGMSGRLSSQFVSAVLLAGPLFPRGVVVRLLGEPVSRPYLDLTAQVMREFGLRMRIDDRTADGQPVFRVPAGRPYRGAEIRIEGDASAASYFWAAAAITGATLRVEGVGRESLQGDLRCADVLAAMGCRVTKERDAVQVVGPALLRGVDADCADMPDVVPTLATAAMFARGRTRLRGVPHLRHKESDRIASVASELRKLGADVRERSDGLEVHGAAGGSPRLHGARVDPWGDHRIAMALSVAGLVVPGVSIGSPQVVGKSFPAFFHALAALGASVGFVGGDGERRPVRCEGAAR